MLFLCARRKRVDGHLNVRSAHELASFIEVVADRGQFFKDGYGHAGSLIRASKEALNNFLVESCLGLHVVGTTGAFVP